MSVRAQIARDLANLSAKCSRVRVLILRHTMS